MTEKPYYRRLIESPFHILGLTPAQGIWDIGDREPPDGLASDDGLIAWAILQLQRQQNRLEAELCWVHDVPQDLVDGLLIGIEERTLEEIIEKCGELPPLDRISIAMDLIAARRPEIGLSPLPWLRDSWSDLNAEAYLARINEMRDLAGEPRVDTSDFLEAIRGLHAAQVGFIRELLGLMDTPDPDITRAAAAFFSDESYLPAAPEQIVAPDLLAQSDWAADLGIAPRTENIVPRMEADADLAEEDNWFDVEEDQQEAAAARVMLEPEPEADLGAPEDWLGLNDDQPEAESEPAAPAPAQETLAEMLQKDGLGLRVEDFEVLQHLKPDGVTSPRNDEDWFQDPEVVAAITRIHEEFPIFDSPPLPDEDEEEPGQPGKKRAWLLPAVGAGALGAVILGTLLFSGGDEGPQRLSHSDGQPMLVLGQPQSSDARAAPVAQADVPAPVIAPEPRVVTPEPRLVADLGPLPDLPDMTTPQTPPIPATEQPAPRMNEIQPILELVEADPVPVVDAPPAEPAAEAPQVMADAPEQPVSPLFGAVDLQLRFPIGDIPVDLMAPSLPSLPRIAAYQDLPPAAEMVGPRRAPQAEAPPRAAPRLQLRRPPHGNERRMSIEELRYCHVEFMTLERLPEFVKSETARRAMLFRALEHVSRCEGGGHSRSDMDQVQRELSNYDFGAEAERFAAQW